MGTDGKISSISDWMKLPEISAPSLSSDRETGLVLTIAKVGFLAVAKSDCENAGIKAEGPGGKARRCTSGKQVRRSDRILCVMLD